MISRSANIFLVALALGVVFPSYANAVSASISDPITFLNKDKIFLTGTALSSSTVNYSIDDDNSATGAVTGSGEVSGTGAFRIGPIAITTLSDGRLTLTVTIIDTENVSSTVTKKLKKDVTPPTVQSVAVSVPDGLQTVATDAVVSVGFTEQVTGDIRVGLYASTGVSPFECTVQISGQQVGSCKVSMAAGKTSFGISVTWLSGTIFDELGNAMTDFTPPSTVTREILLTPTEVPTPEATPTPEDTIEATPVPTPEATPTPEDTIEATPVPTPEETPTEDSSNIVEILSSIGNGLTASIGDSFQYLSVLISSFGDKVRTASIEIQSLMASFGLILILGIWRGLRKP